MPVALSYPGVYIEEVPSGVRTITGVATSIALFLGWAPRGPVDRAVRLTSFADYERTYGGLDRVRLLGYAVGHFYDNGGAGRVRAAHRRRRDAVRRPALRHRRSDDHGELAGRLGGRLPRARHAARRRRDPFRLDVLHTPSNERRRRVVREPLDDRGRSALRRDRDQRPSAFIAGRRDQRRRRPRPTPRADHCESQHDAGQRRNGVRPRGRRVPDRAADALRGRARSSTASTSSTSSACRDSPTPRTVETLAAPLPRRAARS